MEIFDLNTPKIDTITISSKIELVKHTVEPFEFYSTSDSNQVKLKKLSNFTSWEFTVYKTTETDVVWTAIVSSLEALNTGEPMICEIDTVNNSGIKFLCMFDCYYDRVSDNPVKRIICNLYRVYSDGNEVSPFPAVNNLVHYWTFDVEGSILDAVGTDDGTLDNSPTYESSGGKSNSCYSFAHAFPSQKILVPSRTYGSSSFTVNFWANMSAVGFPTKGTAFLGETGNVRNDISFNDTNTILNVDTNGGSGVSWTSSASFSVWNMITITCYNSGTDLTYSAYINGIKLVPIGLDVTSLANTLTINSIGEAYNDNSILTGKLDELAIFDINLTDAQVLELYNSGDGVFYEDTRESLRIIAPNGGESILTEAGTIITWVSTNLLVTDLVKIELWKGGVYDSNIVSSTDNDGSYTWDTSSLSGATDYKVKIELVLDDTVSDISDANFTLETTPSDFLAYWKYDDNLATTNVIEETGSYNATSGQNTSLMSTTGVKGTANTALSFNGSTDYVTRVMTSLGTEFSVSIWIKKASNSNGWIINRKDNVGDATEEWNLFFSTSGSFLSLVIVNTLDADFKVTFPSIPYTGSIGTWFHVGFSVASDKSIVTYVNGVQDNTGSYTGTMNAGAVKTVVGFPAWQTLGSSQANAFDGDIDNPQLFTRTLSAVEFLAIYNDEKP